MQANIALNLAKRQVKGNQNTDKSNLMNSTGIQIGNHMDAEFTLSKQKKENQKQKKLQPTGNYRERKTSITTKALPCGSPLTHPPEKENT